MEFAIWPGTFNMEFAIWPGTCTMEFAIWPSIVIMHKYLLTVLNLIEHTSIS